MAPSVTRSRLFLFDFFENLIGCFHMGASVNSRLLYPGSSFLDCSTTSGILNEQKKTAQGVIYVKLSVVTTEVRASC